MNLPGVLAQGGTITVLVAVLLLLMSVASWVVIAWKSWMLHRAVRVMLRAVLRPSGNPPRWMRRVTRSPPLTARRWSCTHRSHKNQHQRHTGHRRRPNRSSSHACCVMPCMPCCTSCNLARCCWQRWALSRRLWFAWHCLGHLSRADRHCIGWPDHHRQGVRPRGRGPHHDGGRSGGGDSRSAGVQHLWPLYWPY